jgi:CO/xanthine dehydrogenase Mo-binding subunit
VVTGVVDMSGTDGSLSAIAASAFGIPPEQVRMVHVGTDAAPRSPLTGGSVVTYGAGRAIEKAARQARDRLLSYAATQLEIEPTDLEIADGEVRPKGSPDRGIRISTLADRLEDFGPDHEPVEGHGSADLPALAPSVSGHLAHVRVDPDTGRVEVLHYLVAQDVGRAINPALVEGQMRGGATQAMGWALLEEMRFDDEGQLVTGTFLDYAVPRASQVPPIETAIVEVPAPDGPYGARGVGEASVCGGAAAVANAVARATGVRHPRMPLTPPRVLAALTQSRR